MKVPTVVSQEDWKTALERLRPNEKAATRGRDALAAERRRLPMIRAERDYVFVGPQGTASLATTLTLAAVGAISSRGLLALLARRFFMKSIVSRRIARGQRR